MRTITKYHDRYQLLHHKETNGDPETSENSPMFCGLECAAMWELGELDWIAAKEYVTEVIPYFYSKHSYWIASATSTRDDCSRDNFSGIISMIKLTSKYPINRPACKRLRKLVPLFHKQLMHPRDFIMVGYLKYPILFWPLLWFPAICYIISCAQKYKVRNGNKIIKTDGKLIARMITKSFNMRITFWLCNKVLRWFGVFETWVGISWTYFIYSEHPINEKYWRLNEKI